MLKRAQVRRIVALIAPIVLMAVGAALGHFDAVGLMAVYTPATLVATKAFGNGAGNIGTWRYQNTGGAGTFGIVRTCVIETPTAARTVTLQQGATAADTTAQRIADAYALTANIPWILNGWYVVPNNEYFQGFANAADINGAAYGYTYS